MSALPAINTDPYSILENIVADGDLSKLSPKQRVEYYHKVCKSAGLNPITRPFEYQRFNGKVVLYARKDAAEQLRFVHKVSIYKMEKETFEGVFLVTAYARTADGKEDVSTGGVSIAGLKGEALANAYMKAETKAKRRVTLSICGLGFLDETEVVTIPNSHAVQVDHETGEILEAVPMNEAKFKSDEEIMKDITPEQIEHIAKQISTAEDMTSLKIAYAQAFVLHGLRENLMLPLKELKDARKQQLEEMKNAVPLQS